MKIPSDKAITLMELLIALILLSVVVLSFSSIDTFSRGHVISAERRTKIQNEASYILEHMRKTIMNATLGNINNNTTPIVTNPGYLAFTADPIGGTNWNAYTWNSTNYQFAYCSQFTRATGQCNNPSVISTKMKVFNTSIIGSSVLVGLTECWDPATAGSSPPYGKPDNPCTIMNTSIFMPSVSSN